MKSAKAALIIPILFLAACQNPAALEPKLQIVNVPTPVPVKCKPTLDPVPVYPDAPAALKAAPDIYTQIQLLLAGRVMRITREAELQAALSACEG